MILKLFILFTVVPLLELFLLIQVGSRIGTMETIAIVLGTALLGAILIKLQGLMVIDNIKDALLEKRFPADEILNALIVVISGALLITPGILTDIVSILLLTPPGAGLVRDVIKSKLREKIGNNNIKTIRIEKP